MDSIWLYGGCMMNFIKRVNWMNLFLWVGLLTMSITIWYYIIKLITKLIRSL